MTHIFITQELNSNTYEVRYGDLCIHVEDYNQAMELALRMGVQLGLIGC